MSLTNWNTAGSKTGASKTASPGCRGFQRYRWIQYDEPANRNIWGLLNIRKKNETLRDGIYMRTVGSKLNLVVAWCCMFSGAGYLSSPCRSIPCSVVRGFPRRRQAWWPASCVWSRAASAAPVAFSSSPWCGSTCGLCPGPKRPRAPFKRRRYGGCVVAVTWSNHE